MGHFDVDDIDTDELLLDMYISDLREICKDAEEKMKYVWPEPTKLYTLLEVLNNYERLIKAESDEKFKEYDNYCINEENLWEAWSERINDQLSQLEPEITNFNKNTPSVPISPDEITREILHPWRKSMRGNVYLFGLFDGKGIKICIERIKRFSKEDPEKTKRISYIILLHELAHAMMDNKDCNPGEIPYLDWTEEAMANKVMLNYILYAGNMELFNEAIDFVTKQQPIHYQRGITLLKNHCGDFEIFRTRKAFTNKDEGVKFMILLYKLGLERNLTKELNQTFYKMMNVKS